MSKINKLIKNDSGSFNPGLLIVALALIGLVYLMSTAAYVPNCPAGQTWNGSGCVPSTPTPTPTPNPTPVVTTPAPTGVNIVQNPTFIGTSSWILYTNGIASFNAVNSEGVIAVTSPSTNTQILQLYVPVKPNTRYILSFSMSSTPAPLSSPEVRVIDHNAPYTQLASIHPTLGTTSNTYSTEFTTPATVPMNTRLMFFFNSPATYRISAVSIRQV